MELRMETGTVCLPVVRDGERVGEMQLNPLDVTFAARFYDLEKTVDTGRDALHEALANAANAGERIRLLEEYCMRVRGGIDTAFGAGTCDMVFGAQCTPAMLVQFFTAVASVVEKARGAKLAAYTADIDAAEADTAQDSTDASTADASQTASLAMPAQSAAQNIPFAAEQNTDGNGAQSAAAPVSL